MCLTLELSHSRHQDSPQLNLSFVMQ